MKRGTNLSDLFDLRSNFTIVALTGRHGSGYDDIAKQLEAGFNNEDFENPESFDLNYDAFKKYRIIYSYAEKHFRKFSLIRYKDVITLYLLKYPFSRLEAFLRETKFDDLFAELRDSQPANFKDELKSVTALKFLFQEFKLKFSEVKFGDEIDSLKAARTFFSLFFSQEFRDFSNSLHRSFQSKSFVKHNILIDLLTSNIRKTGNPYSDIESIPQANKIFSLAELINQIIKVIRKHNGDSPSKIVIDSMRIPFEVMFFKQRFSAFYLMAVNKDDVQREKKLKEYYKLEYDNIIGRLEQEYKGGKGNSFYKQYVRECIEKADVHITHRTKEETNELNSRRDPATSPYYSWQMQLLKYVTLIDHPGLVTPSPEERCMQLAYTAKYNSGCISRQVGATITDENYSVKAVGWNSTPAGQTPCLLRNAEVLLDHQIEVGSNSSHPELEAFTPYEREDEEFKVAIQKHYTENLKTNRKLVAGQNICFCFKSLKNSYSEGKNQVHTRSLHAEENAFLQIAKYGGTAIKNGKLFSTASPCELCSKKAYQLGIKVIYYVDPYPGISQRQIIDTGSHRPELRLFNGAVGSAYGWLYDPIMPYKDELSLKLGQDIEDLATTQKRAIRLLENENKKLNRKVKRMKSKK